MSRWPSPVAGVLLAAGSGRRMGMPKGLLRDADGTPRVSQVCSHLRDAGCAPISVVLGAAAEEVTALLPGDVAPVIAEDWETGMGASLRAGLTALTNAEVPQAEATGASTQGSDAAGRSAVATASAALIMLVDLPGVDDTAITRIITHGFDAFPEIEHARVRATWNDQPGHPVLLGRFHWPAAIHSAVGDQGARALLDDSGTVTVECGDLGSGADLDRPEDVESFRKESFRMESFQVESFRRAERSAE